MALSTLKINDVYIGIQGEGRYAGTPMTFVRLAGCNQFCDFCDTDHSTRRKVKIKDLAEEICDISEFIEFVCWTGGEPTLQIKEVVKLIDMFDDSINATLSKLGYGECSKFEHHIETNGANLCKELNYFDYIAFSPKNLEDAMKIQDFIYRKEWNWGYDVKIVTDLRNIGTDMLDYATMLMPLTTYDMDRDIEIMRHVWDYCIKNRLNFSPRLQIVTGKK